MRLIAGPAAACLKPRFSRGGPKQNADPEPCESPNPDKKIPARPATAACTRGHVACIVLAVMLERLQVHNLAVVEKAEVRFTRGLNVITGETGAGKSVLVGALQLVLGGRSERAMLRTGADKLSVDAEFSLQQPEAIDAILDDADIEPCEAGRLMIRRSLTAAGSSRITVNDTSATVAILKRIGTLLVDMHGPHDHQSLLDPSFQLRVLDAFGQLESEFKTYKTHYSTLNALESKRSALTGDDGAIEREIDMLKYQVQEIEKAELNADDEETLEREHAEAANASLILETANAITDTLTESEPSTFNSLVTAQRAIRALQGVLPEAEAWMDEAEALTVQVQELATTVSARAQDVEVSPERLQWLEDRMALVQGLKRKYGGTVEDILAHDEKQKARLDDLSGRGDEIARLDSEIDKAHAAVMKSGKALGKARRLIAKKLAQAITTELRDLGFQKGTFEAGINDGPPGPTGTDAMEFGFAPNLGETMRPLRAIASSGEISRVMLAVKSVLALHDKIPLLVFDEIDANIGGEIGNAVGSKLRGVAKHHQVVCITHLPQVAVCGHSHYMVSKHVEDGRTRAEISPIVGDVRTDEVARMLGGRGLTSVTTDHASEMLAQHDN